MYDFDMHAHMNPVKLKKDHVKKGALKEKKKDLGDWVKCEKRIKILMFVKFCRCKQDIPCVIKSLISEIITRNC